VVVSDAAVASGIRDLRRALGDSSSAPRYIQTVHRRGFRFIGPVAQPGAFVACAATPGDESSGQPAASVAPRSPPAALVGREAELARLHAALVRALSGQRQLVFVTGEPGIGKTTLVEMFLGQVGEAQALRIGHGQCVEQYGRPLWSRNRQASTTTEDTQADGAQAQKARRPDAVPRVHPAPLETHDELTSAPCQTSITPAAGRSPGRTQELPGEYRGGHSLVMRSTRRSKPLGWSLKPFTPARVATTWTS
jgi:hypothetical protein